MGGPGSGATLVGFPSSAPFGYADADGMAEFIRPWLEPWMKQAYAVLVDPTRQFSQYDVDTDEQIVVPYVVWFGDVRVQPLRTDLNSIRSVNDSTTRPVQFWLPFPKDNVVPDVRPGFQFAVTDGGNDPMLTKYMYSVTGSMNSSMAWQRTVNTITDMELRPDWDVSWVDVDADEGDTVEAQFQVDGVWRTSFAGVGVAQVPVFEGAGVVWRVMVDGVEQ